MTEPERRTAAPTVGELVNDGRSAGIALAGRASLIREATVRRFREETTRIGQARDDASRDLSSHEQEAKAAEAQVTGHEKELKTLNADLSRARARLAEAKRNAADDNDFNSVGDAEETVAMLRVRLESATFRRDRAADEAIGLREDAAEAKATVTRLDSELRATSERVAQADRLLDPLEEKADLLERAKGEQRISENSDERAMAARSAGNDREAANAEHLSRVARERAYELNRKAERVVVNSAALTELEAELLPADPSLQFALRGPQLPAVPIDPSPSTPSMPSTPAEALPDPTVSPDLVDDDLITPATPSAPESSAPSDSATMPDDRQPADADVGPLPLKPNDFSPGGTGPRSAPSEPWSPFDDRQLQLDEPPVSFPEAPDPIVTDLDAPLPSSPSDEEFGFDDNSVTASVDDEPAPFDLP